MFKVAVADPEQAATERCLATFDEVDAYVDAEGVRDAQDTRIHGFPYLRVNRLLNGLASHAQDERLRAWIEQLARLDRTARQFEIANLATATRARIDALARSMHGAGIQDALDECRTRLIARDLSDAERWRLLRERAVVPSDYSTWKRIVGLYAITSLVFHAGVRRFEAQMQATFDAPSVATTGRRIHYAPAGIKRLTPAAVRDIMRRAPANTLGLREPAGEDRDALLAAFAPEFAVDETGDYDRIGALRWRDPGILAVDGNEPLVYARTAHTLIDGQALLQLVYTIWFAERPADGPFDLLSGHLDGLVWRVTLTPDGEPWIFDSIHPCGCYHQFFPTARAQPKPAPDPIEEWAFVPQRLPRLSAGERVAVHLTSRTHYIERIEIGPSAPSQWTYRLVDDAALRSLSVPDGGHRSAFGPDGIVAGTERAERFFFWPMGIASAGAMRQWGRHATAFIGRRHFDDHDLLEQRFTLLTGD